MLPRSGFLLADSKSNSSTLLPLSTTTRVSSGWEASIIILLDMLNSLEARPRGPQRPHGTIEGQARRANVWGGDSGKPFRRGRGPVSIATHAGTPDTKIHSRDPKRGKMECPWRPKHRDPETRRIVASSPIEGRSFKNAVVSHQPRSPDSRPTMRTPSFRPRTPCAMPIAGASKAAEGRSCARASDLVRLRRCQSFAISDDRRGIDAADTIQ